MKKFLLIACSLQAALLSAQTFGWAINHGGSGNDVPRDIATDAAGNVYTVGYFNGTVDFDPGAGSFPLTSLGGQDIFISKLDPSGNLLWAARIGGAGNEQANGIALDASANMHITGCFYGTVDFDPGPGVFNSGNMTGADIYVLKLTSTGGFVWFKQMGGTNDNQQGNEIAVDAAGNVYSTGQSIGVIDFDPGPGTAQLGVAFSGNTNFYVSKLDINGNYVWAKVIGNSSAGVYGMDIAVNAAQEVYTCGYFIGTVDFDPGTGTFSSGSGSANNTFIHKYTSAGNFSFMKRVGTGNVQCESYAMAKTANNIYITGYFYATSDLDPGTGTVNHTSAGVQDVFIASYDNLGIYQWSKQIGGVGQDYGWAIATDALGAIYTCGTYDGTVDFDPGAGSSPLTSSNLRDVFISKLLPNGNYAWGFSIGGTGLDVGQGITVSPAGSVYSTGFKSGTGDYDPTAGTFNLAHGGGYDAFVQKMEQCLTPLAPSNTTAPAALTICSNSSATLTATGFGTLGWYSASSGGTYLGGGSSFSTPALTSNTTYYVQDSLCAAGVRTAIAVTVSPAMTPSLSSSTNVTCNGGTNGAATVGVTGGTPGYTYLWSPSGGTAATASSLASNSYTCTITDAAGCTTTQTVSITQPASLSVTTTSQTNLSCNGGSNGAATVSVSGGTTPYTYAWAPSGGTSATITGRSAGTYTCTITDAAGCTSTQTVTLTQPTVITSSISSQTNISCNGGNNGAAAVSVSGGTPGYTYSWAPSGGTTASITGRTAGTYTCTITDANGCTQTQTVSLTQPTGITSSVSSQTNILCNGGSNGAATVAVSGGTPGYTYSWSPSGGTSATATGLSATAYTCTITDANACTTTQTVMITQPTAISVSVSSQTNVSCGGGADGAAAVTASGGAGGFTYAWSPSGGTAATASGLSAATYTCTITDANSCSATQTVTITEPSAISITVASQSNVLCNGSNEGAALILATGGVGGYTYSWLPSGGSNASTNGLIAGTYSCIVTDAASCTSTQTILITEPTALSVNITSSDITCNGADDGTATVSASGGTPAYSYMWMPSGGTDATESSLMPGAYTCDITDANGCSVTVSVTINEPAVLATSQTVTLCAGQSLTVGTNTYTVTGTYNDLLQSVNGCDSTVTTDLTVEAPVDVTTTLNGNTVSANQNGATYQWIDCLNGNTPVAGETNQSFTPQANGDYAVIVTVGACSDTSACTNVITGIENRTSAAFSVYPNPTNGVVTIQLNQISSDAQIEIFNATGQLVVTEKPLGNSVSLVLPADNGMYLVRITMNGSSTTRTVIKE